MALDISVIILTYNEGIHIRRCIESVRGICADIFVVDCFSTDQTKNIAESLGARVFEQVWPGNQAEQMNWALTHLPIKTKWILRLDADEYLTDGLKKEIESKLGGLPQDITGCVFKRRHIFLGKWIKAGIYPVKLLRLFQYQKAVCEQRLMDEHIQLLEGNNVEFEHDFVDDNLNNLSWWSQKHIGYAIREAVDLLDLEYGLFKGSLDNQGTKLGKQAAEKRAKKMKYARMPLFWRAFAYFVYRYIIKGGWLEGKEGFLWHFLQGWWYRTLVDAKIFELKVACGNDRQKIITHIKENYGINCDWDD